MTVGQGGAGGAGGRVPSLGDQDKAAVAHLNVLATRFYGDGMPGSWVPRYLEARGFGSAVQVRWHAGHAPATWDALTRHLRALGYPDELIERAGLARQSQRGSLIDVFRDRAVFPIRSTTGSVTGFIGRARDARIAGAPKYLNTPRTCLYDKSRLLFGLYEARAALAAGARPVIVEGPFDAIAVTAAGEQRFAGVGTCGTAVTAQHIAGLAQVTDLRAVGAIAGFDPDFAGRRAAVRAYHLLRTFTDKLDAADLEDGQDPAHIFESQGPTALAETLVGRTRPLADVVVDNEVERWSRWMCYPEGQVHALRAAARLIVAMPPSHVGRQVSRLASGLGFDHAVVTEAVTDALTEYVAGTGAACSPRSRTRSPRSPPLTCGLRIGFASIGSDRVTCQKVAGGQETLGRGGGRRGPKAMIIAPSHPTPVGAPIRFTRNTSARPSTLRIAPTSVGSRYSTGRTVNARIHSTPLSANASTASSSRPALSGSRLPLRARSRKPFPAITL